MLYLLDTNALTRLARGADTAIAQKVDENALNCRLSAIAWFELLYGAARSPNREKAVPRLKFLRSISLTAGLEPAISSSVYSAYRAVMGWLAAAPDGAGLELGVGPAGPTGPGRNAAAACWGWCWIQPCSSAWSKLD